MRECLNSNVVKELKGRLISYIIVLNPNKEQLETLSYEELLEKYRNLLCARSDYPDFDAQISSIIKSYRENDPDTPLLDEEIILAHDILCPINFIGLLSHKIVLLAKRLARLEGQEFELETNNDDLSEQILGDLHSKNEADRIICNNYIQKCQRLIEIIQEEYGVVRERRQ